MADNKDDSKKKKEEVTPDKLSKAQLKKISDGNRLISGNINALMDDLYRSVLGTGRRDEIDQLNDTFDDIVKSELSSITNKSDGNITSFLTKLVSNVDKNLAAGSRNGDPFGNVSKTQIDNILTEAYRNRLLKQNDLHEVASQLNELREAILITRDSILSSDVVEGSMSREIVFKNSTTKDLVSGNISIIEKMEEKFKLKDKIKNFIVPKTLEYGEYYAYVTPYSKLFSDFEKYKVSKNGMLSFNESTIFESVSAESGSKNDLNKYFKSIKPTLPKDITSDSEAYNSFTEEVRNAFENVTICAEGMPLPVLENGISSIEELYKIYKGGETNIFEDCKKAPKKSLFQQVTESEDGVIIENDPKKIDKSFEHIKDCYVRLIDPTKIIPVKIMNYTIGYYYIQDTDITHLDSTLGSSMYYDKYTGGTDRSIADVVANQIIKSFNKKFLDDNMQFKDLIVNAISYYDLHQRKLKFQFIPAEYIVEFKINEDENGNGTSIIEPALFYAKLYLMLLLFKMMSIITLSNDTRVHYLRQSGIDKNVTNYVQETARKMQARQINVLDMFSYTTLINKVGQGSELFIPTGRNNERGIETEILSGQEVALNTDLMDMLRTNYISATGVPSVMMNYINEADFAKTIELANTRFQGRVVSNQLDFNGSITEFYKRIMKFSTNIDPNEIDNFTFSFCAPKYSNATISSDMIQNFQNMYQFVSSALFGDTYLSTPEGQVASDKLQIKLIKNKLPTLDIDSILLDLKEAKLEAHEFLLDPTNAALFSQQQE